MQTQISRETKDVRRKRTRAAQMEKGLLTKEEPKEGPKSQKERRTEGSPMARKERLLPPSRVSLSKEEQLLAAREND